MVGNDHFTALPELCLRNQPYLIDFGFVGNEVVGSFCSLVDQVVNSRAAVAPVPGMIARNGHGWLTTPQAPEPVFTGVDYRLLDSTFKHSSVYDRCFQTVFPQRIQSWFGRRVHRGVAVDIARGCVKFQGDDACSFCSIQYGGMWKNSVNTAELAWDALGHAFHAGYDYLYITADELALTHRRLLAEMQSCKPSWLTNLSPEDQPVLTGYARTDGIVVEKNARLLYDLGFRVIMAGVDAGPRISLDAVNKPLHSSTGAIHLDQLYAANRQAFEVARRIGLKLRIGFVLGHVGLTRALLTENVQYLSDLVAANPGAVCTADIEVLSPEPGSREYQHLTRPELASSRATALGLGIADELTRRLIAEKWLDRDVIDREEIVQDYATAFMPELDFEELIQARLHLREVCKRQGILIGDPETSNTPKD